MRRVAKRVDGNAFDLGEGRLVDIPSASILLLVMVLGVSSTAIARQSTPPVSRQRAVKPIDQIQVADLPAVDVPALLAEDADAQTPWPLRFARPTPFHATPATHGTWEQFADGGRLWRMRVFSPGATDLNFGFTRYRLPPGATLHIYSEVENYVIGPYTDRDNKPHGQLWTPLVPGEHAVIEFYVPPGTKGEHELSLTSIGCGYRDLLRRKSGSIPKAAACNNDVICPVGDPWRNEIRSVARYSISGSALCTGTLLMDAAGDFRNFFLTANHCELDPGNAPSVVVYWNFESPTCGQLGGGSLADTQNGATFRAAKADTDFALIELDDTPSPNSRVYYSGWDRSGTAPVGGVCIHHPSGDEKAISFNTNLLFTVNSCITNNVTNTHWRVDNWEDGTTEPGSSGSGIWNPSNHLVVGTLSGGSADCPDLNGGDCFGKFSVAWTNGTTAATRLRDWLDPLNTGAISVPGSDPPLLITNAIPSDATGGNANGGIDPGETISETLVLRNPGGNIVSNVTSTIFSGGAAVTVTQPNSTYPNIPAGGLTTNTTPFQYRLAKTVPCSSTITFTNISMAGAKLFTNTFSHVVGLTIVATNTFNSSNVPKTIIDNGTIYSTNTIALATTNVIDDVDVTVRLNHTFDQDLQIAIQHPDSTEILLADQRGGSGVNYGTGTCGAGETRTTFDDEAATSISAGTAPFTGSFRPEGMLSNLDGKLLNGAWRLRVTDTAVQDIGTLTCWGLRIISHQQQVVCSVFNNPPVASNQTTSVSADVATALILKGSDVDGDPISFKTNSLPAHGLLSNLGTLTGSITYTPAHGYSGADSFTFKVNDSVVDSATATVSLTVTVLTDTDADGMPNVWEAAHGLDSGNGADASTDADGDGMTNLQEYLANTDPQVSSSLLRFTSVTRDGAGHATITWSAIGGTRYRVQYSNGGAGGSYNGVFTDIVRPASTEIDPATVGTVSSMSFTDDFTLTGGAPPQGTRHFRILIVQ